MIRPLRITTLGGYVMCLDAAMKMIVMGIPYSGSPGFILLTFGEPAILPADASPVDIGLNASNNIIVPDNGLNMIHVYDFYGNYICSYDGNNTPVSFDSPQRATNVLINHQPVGTFLEFATSDRWSASHGLKRFLPGADAVQFKITEQGDNFKFSCVITDAGPYSVTLYKLTTNPLFTENFHPLWGGDLYERTVSKSSLGTGRHKWVVTTTPENDGLYGSYAVGPRSREFFFDYQNTLSPVITSSKTISGIVYCNGTVIGNNSTLTISPGTIIYMNPNKDITVTSGSKIIAIGDDNYRITFKQASPGNKWGEINLFGDGNQFKYCTFSGGNYGAYIRSSDNTFSNCKFSYNNQGIKTYTHIQGGWSDFDLTECFFSNNGYGVNASYTYGSINNCTIQESNNDGLYLYNARVGNDIDKVFSNNYIGYNARYGINLQLNGKLWLGYDWKQGNNKIYNNDSHEIYLASSTSARLYDSDNGGYSYIYDSPTSRYI